MEAAQDHIDFSVESHGSRFSQAAEAVLRRSGDRGLVLSHGLRLAPGGDRNLLTRVHLKHFGGEKVLMLMEPAGA
ncbi:MAG: hypothetical protein ACLUTA_13235 [Blautia wexlerae]